MSKRTQRFAEFKIKIAPEENWSLRETNELFKSIMLLVDIMGGRENFTRHLGEVIIERTETGVKLGLAYRDRIQLSAKAPVSSWSVIHERANVWYATHAWI